MNLRISLRLNKEGRAERNAIFSALRSHDDWLKQVPAYDLPRYRKVVSDLPRPSARQIHKFARFVSQAHSWYKHLPLMFPGTVFQFYLDPCVGCDTEQQPDGGVRIVERTGSGGFHYTWMPTKTYRERFGYLAYHCNAGTSFVVQTGGTMRRYDEPTALAFTAEGKPFLVPAGLGCVELTGVIHQTSSEPWTWAYYFNRSENQDAWPAETGGEATVQRLREIARAWEAGDKRRAHSVRIGRLGRIDREIEALIMPERRRLHQRMCDTITRMLETLDA